MATFRIRPGLRKSDPNPNSPPVTPCQVWRPLARTVQDEQLLLEQKMRRDHRAHATGATQRRGHEENWEFETHRIAKGRPVPRRWDARAGGECLRNVRADRGIQPSVNERQRCQNARGRRRHPAPGSA